MAVPGFKGHLRTTANGTFTKQTYGGCILGNNATSTGRITKSFPLLTALSAQGPRSHAHSRELDAAGYTYSTHKALSGGTFDYMGRTSGVPTWVVSRIATTLSGASNTKLLFMAEGALHKHINEFVSDFGAKLNTAWRGLRFSFTHRDMSGVVLAARHNWMNTFLTGTGTPTDLTTTNMHDIVNGNATTRPADDDALPTRAIPGELVMKIDFVTNAVATSGNNYNYSAITGK